MRKYGELEIKLLNIQIGCVLRLARLKENLSQLNLALTLNTSSTMIGRVERFEHVSGWDTIFSISQYFQIDFCSLFILKSKEEILLIIEESLGLEKKLTEKKGQYYVDLKKKVNEQYTLLKK